MNTNIPHEEIATENLPRDFKGIWIPREIWLHTELLPLEKLLWAEIHSLYERKRGGCFATNTYLAKFLGVTDRYVREMISKLKRLGFVKDVAFDGRTRILTAILPPEDLKDQHQFHSDRNSSSGQGGTAVPGGEEPQFRPPIYIENKEENKDINLAKSSKTTSDNVRDVDRPSYYPPQVAQTASPLRKTGSKERISFDFEKNDFSGINSQDYKDWHQAYPGIDLSIEFAKMRKWCEANSQQARAKRQWLKFINSWLSKAFEKESNRKAYREDSHDKTQSVKNKVLEKFKHGETYNGATCWISENEIAFERGMIHMKVRFKDLGFWEQFNSMLRKFEIA